MGWKTYVIILLAILGKECSRGRHRENGSECVIFRELCNNEPKIANSMHVWNWEIEIEDTGLLMVVRMLKEEEKEEEKRREEKRCEMREMGSKQDLVGLGRRRKERESRD